MPLWEVTNSPLGSHGFGQIVPAEVLAAFDGPHTFTFYDARGTMYLAHMCAVGGGLSRYVVSKTSNRIIVDLKNGMTSIRGAILRSQLWLMDVRPDGTPANVWQTSAEELPPNALPDSDVLLTEALEEEQRADEKLARFAKSGSDGQVAIDGGPVVGNDIDAGFAGEFFVGTNGLYVEICKVYGVLASSLRLGIPFPSSYAVDLRASEQTGSDWEPMFPEALPPNNDRASEALELLASLMVDPEPTAEAVTLIKRLYSLRQLYGGFLELISKNGATVVVRTRGKPHGRRMTGTEAGERLRVVRQLGYPYMHLEVRGRLIGGLAEKSGRTEPFFWLRVETGGKPEDYKGDIANDVLERMREYKFNEEVRAKLQIRDVGKEPQEYTLAHIEIAEDGSPHSIA